MPETAKRTARVPILGEDGRISDDYIPAAIGEGVTKAEAAATRAETAATNAEGSAAAAGQSATQASGSASAAGTSAAKAQQSAATAGGAATSAQSAQTAAEAAKTAAEAAQSAAAGSAQDAQQSAAAAAQSAASVADKFISSAQATTLEPGSQATASVANQVLTIGVPKGEKGDKGDTGEKGDPGTTPNVVAAEGSDISVSTDEGTVTIDDSALRARIEELENASRNVLTGTATGYVAHAEDAFPQKPREVRIKGKTWVNRWLSINGSMNGLTVSTDDTGLTTISGTPTNRVELFSKAMHTIKPNTSYSYRLTNIVSDNVDNASFVLNYGESNNSHFGTTTTGTFVSKNFGDNSTVRCEFYIRTGSPLIGKPFNWSGRVMLVDGTEAPDCFTPPASITSAQPENLVTSGKNLLPEDPFSISDTYLDCGVLLPGDYVLSFENGTAWWETATTGDRILPSARHTTGVRSILMRNTVIGQRAYGTFTNSHTQRVVFTDFGDGTFSNQSDFMVELGSTATAYEPPAVIETPLPEVELRGLPDGTCDELVIKEDGACEVERKTGYIASYTDEEVTGEYVSTGNGLEAGASIVYELDEPTTEPQSPVTLTALPAPTFNQYHDSSVPSDTSTEYVRDINIVLDQLEAKIAALSVAQATS
mgnify:CR=1 FL=1